MLDVEKIRKKYQTQQINSFTSSSNSRNSQVFQHSQKVSSNYNNSTTTSKNSTSKPESKSKGWCLHSLLAHFIPNQNKCSNGNCPFKHLSGPFRPSAGIKEDMCKSVMKMDKNTGLRDQLLDAIKSAK